MGSPRCMTAIVGFRQDVAGDWVAVLSCAHSQHLRHHPPWQLRPWVMTAEGRASRLGAPLECPLCGMPKLPPEVAKYQRTAAFTEATIPAGLLRDHRTKQGVWARIVVEAGELRYQLGGCAFILSPEYPGIVPPATSHQVTPSGSVRFHVEFLRGAHHARLGGAEDVPPR